MKEWWNNRVKKARVCIENAFGMLKGRWQMLRDFNMHMLDDEREHALAWTIIKAAMVLHNLYIDTANYYEPPEGWDKLPEMRKTTEGPLDLQGLPVGPQLASDEAFKRREQIAFLTGWHSPSLLPNKQFLKLFPVQQDQIPARELRNAVPGLRAIVGH